MSRVSRITRACTMLAGAASFVTTVFVLDLGCGGGTFGAPADAGDASDATSFRHPKFDDLPPEEDAPYIPPRPSRVPDGWDLYTDYYPG